MTIKEILIKYSNELENISDTPRLDVEMLLKKALGDVDSMYIRMYLDKELTDEQEKYFLEMIKERLNERPIAYGFRLYCIQWQKKLKEEAQTNSLRIKTFFRSMANRT